jgi:prepilin-type N-terminal cleavage/methylation domain-containing protein
MTQPLCRLERRRGYTLVEAMIALSLIAMAGAVVLLSVETALDAADRAYEQNVAAGLADQLLDEVLGAPYHAADSNPYRHPLGPSTWESQGAGRERYNETGDYHGFTATPPKDRYGANLGKGNDASGARHPNFAAPGNAFGAWRQSVEVYYLAAGDPSVRLSGSATSNYRAVEVVISRSVAEGDVELARRRRVFTYVPKAQ